MRPIKVVFSCALTLTPSIDDTAGWCSIGLLIKLKSALLPPYPPLVRAFLTIHYKAGVLFNGNRRIKERPWTGLDIPCDKTEMVFMHQQCHSWERRHDKILVISLVESDNEIKEYIKLWETISNIPRNIKNRMRFFGDGHQMVITQPRVITRFNSWETITN